MNEKKKVLVFIDWFLPGYRAGGPIRSCTGLVERMSPYFHFRIVTGNTDLGERKPYDSVVTGKWNKLPNGAEVYYADNKTFGVKQIAALINDENPDVVYLNSMFSSRFTLMPLMALRGTQRNIPVVIAPRGMLSRGALALKPLKKKFFLAVARLTGLFRNATFHASTDIEVEEIRNVFGDRVKIVKAINLSPVNRGTLPVRSKQPGELKLIYLGRISRVKNLLYCLQILQQSNPAARITLDVFGLHDDDAYLAECNREIDKMPPHVTVNLKGGLPAKDILEVLKNYHSFFMLTMNENFGHAIVEALTAGCPVIISDRTPWRHLEEKNCGFDIPLNLPAKAVEAINRFAMMNEEEYRQWSAAAFGFAEALHNDPAAINDHIKLFNTAMS